MPGAFSGSAASAAATASAGLPTFPVASFKAKMWMTHPGLTMLCVSGGGACGGGRGQYGMRAGSWCPTRHRSQLACHWPNPGARHSLAKCLVCSST